MTASVDIAASVVAHASQLGALSRWVVQLHEDHRLLYALFAVGVLWLTGLLLGASIEFVLTLLGWGTRRLEMSE